MNSIKEDFEMDLKDWLNDNPNSTREFFIEDRIDSLGQEDDLNEWENSMLEYLIGEL